MNIPKDLAEKAARFVLTVDFTFPQIRVLRIISELEYYRLICEKLEYKEHSLKYLDFLLLTLKENNLDSVEAIRDYLDRCELQFTDISNRLNVLKAKQKLEYDELCQTLIKEYSVLQSN